MSEEINNNGGEEITAENTSPVPEDVIREEKPEKQKRGVPVGVCLLVLICCVLITFMTTYILMTDKSQGTSSDEGETDTITRAVDKLRQIDERIRDTYLYDIDEDTLYDYIIKGYIVGLGDRYAEYFNKEEFAEFIADNNADVEGIGVSVVYDSDAMAIYIIDVFPDSPAEKAGLAPGDFIVSVIEDGEEESVAELGYTMALSKLKGKAGTNAEFIAYKAPDYDTPVEFSIKREHVTQTSVRGRLYNNDETVGVVKITDFNAQTASQFTETVNDLLDKGAERFIFDVRNNPGGELQAICSVLDSLLPEGPIIRIIYNDGTEETVAYSDKSEADFPIVVLANQNTASAAELFTSALRDYKKAVVVGTNTYGKGSIQTIQQLPDGSGIKYTYGYYCPPFSDNYDGVGIAPDIEVELSEEAKQKNIYLLTDEEDNQLKAAYDAVKDIK